MRKAIALALVLVASPAAAQDCISRDRMIADMEIYVRTEDVKARAYAWQSDKKGIDLLIAWFSDAPGEVAITSFRDGCAVLQKDGNPLAIRPISPSIRHGVAESKLLFSNGGVSPFDIY